MMCEFPLMYQRELTLLLLDYQFVSNPVVDVTTVYIKYERCSEEYFI